MRSSKPGSDEIAAAFGTVSEPLFSPAMLTGKKFGGQFVVCRDSSARVCDVESGGTHIGSIPLRMLVCTFMCSCTAGASRYGLYAGPARSWFRRALFCRED